MKVNKISKAHEGKIKKTQKIILSLYTIISSVVWMTILMTTTAFASGGVVDATGFVSKAVTVLETLVIIIGGGLAVWGVVNLLEAYGNDNPGGKSQGIKQLVAGICLIIVGIVLVPVLGNMMSSAL